MIPLLVAPLLISIHVDKVVRRDLDRFFGIDLNYIRDRDSNRPAARPLDEALKEMGVRWLRYPGGEKSNFHLWSEPPYLKPEPKSLGWYATVKGDRMDFDEFIRHSRAVGAEPYVVVMCDTEARTGRTESQQLEAAVAWVRYSRSKGYGVRYWEIGNENWNNHKATPAEMARIVCRFSRAMKAADPSIRVGASGNNDDWWRVFLPIAGPDLDFLSVSQYTGWDWRTYDHFLSGPGLIDTARDAVRAIDRYAPEADRARLEVLVAEANTTDYAPNGWPDANDLGHALVTFATLGRLALEPRVRAAMVWTTRWMDDSEAFKTEIYSLGPLNGLTATGEAIRAWGHFIEPVMLEADGGDAATYVFAARSEDSRAMTVWLLNAGTFDREVRLSIDGASYWHLRSKRFFGPGPADAHPKWVPLLDTKLSPGTAIDRNLPPLSLTVLELSQ